MKDTVYLQGIGEWKNTVKAGELKPGMVTVWNYGYKETVVKVEPTKSGKSLSCLIQDEKGNELVRTLRINTLVAIQEETINPVEKAVKNRKVTYHGVYADVGTALDEFDTLDIAKYMIDCVCGGESALRYYLEQQIAQAEIIKLQSR